MRGMYWPQLLSSLCQVHEQERLKNLLLGIANEPYNESPLLPLQVGIKLPFLGII